MPTDLLTEEERRRRQQEADQSIDVSGIPGTTQNVTTAAPPAPPVAPTTPAGASPVAPAAVLGPTMAPPPPPPPPPPPSGLNDLTGQIGEYASDWLNQPNRYLSPFAEASRAESDARLKEARGAGGRRIDEWIAQRGLSGSSLEGEQRNRLEGEIYRARLGDERQLMRDLTGAETLDRQTAAEIALQTQQAGEGAGLERYRAALDQWIAGEQQREFGGTLDISQQQIDLRAQELMTDAQNEGRSLDLQEARDQARVELEREGMAQQQQQFTSGMQQRESEFARSMGLDERQFEEDQRRFSSQFGEQVASRLQQNEQFKTALASEESRYAMDVGLRQRALDLQKEGMDADSAFRQASLDQERELTEASMRLQEKGMDQDEAYRYSVLEQDAEFQRMAFDLEARGLSVQEAYERAENGYTDPETGEYVPGFRDRELQQRESEFARDLQFRIDQGELEQDRFDQMMDIWRAGLSQEELDRLNVDGRRTRFGDPTSSEDEQALLDWLRRMGIIPSGGGGGTGGTGGGGGGGSGSGGRGGGSTYTGPGLNLTATNNPADMSEEELLKWIQSR